MAELVSPDEAALIGVARALIDGGALPAARSTVPAMISPACARLLGDALAQAWPALWRRGGGTAPAIGHDGARGRVWERHPPTGLAFSAVSFELVRWLAGGGGGGTRVPGAATLGDHVVVYLALATTRGAAIHARLADHPVVRGAPLAWLGFADSLARAGGGAPPTTGFDDLCTGAGAIVVESIAGELAARWRAAELGKRAIRDPHALIALGAAQHRVLDAWLAACDRHARRDLAGFVIDAAQPLL
ncbi:MAG TPA: hypothetical protein VFP84_24745, partial [Kofleriaceae bacterium]|nr:hypothetical protein [Kofleriaceae bacterium]